MRRTGALLASTAAVLLCLPATAQAVAGCAVSALPVPSGAPDGGVATAILDRDTFVGFTNEPIQGQLWRNGSVTPIPIRPDEVSPSGLVVGSSANGQRGARLQLGGTPQLAGYDTILGDVNTAGDSVGTYLTIGQLPDKRNAVWWRAGAAAPTTLPGPQFTGASAIDDLGYKIGIGETMAGERRSLVWDQNGNILRQFGPYPAGQTVIELKDIDDGIAAGVRISGGGVEDIVLVDVRTGGITPVPGTSGFEPLRISDGSVVGFDIDTMRLALWHGGVRYDLPALPNTTPRLVFDLEVYGTTAVLSGFSYRGSSGFFKVPTVWVCG
jgi:hypothetical protein